MSAKKYRQPTNRHTMGNDWGGRRALNPDNCRKVSGDEVRSLASMLAVRVKRDGLGMWFHEKDGQWITLGQTNFLALRQLRANLLYVETTI